MSSNTETTDSLNSNGRGPASSYSLSFIEQLLPLPEHVTKATLEAQRSSLETLAGLDRWKSVLEDFDNTAKAVEALIPWRKGPFKFGDLVIDSEWNSELKWQRIGINDFTGKSVVDLGAGNSFYLYKALQAGASLGIGIDGSALCYFQSLLLKKTLLADKCLYFLLGREELLSELCFKPDYLFCMGVLYHTRNPLGLLQALKGCMVKNTTLVLETIVVPGDDETCLVPEKTYCGMKNVHFLPTVRCLLNWLGKYQLQVVEHGEVSRTTPEEQRSTRFAPFKSLSDGLDSKNPELTVEGYPSPRRVVLKIALI